jgi:dTDP-glucose pyrophosphorylase
LGDGSAIGCQFSYAEQAIPNGLASFCNWGRIYRGDSVALVLEIIFSLVLIWMNYYNPIKP